MPSSNRRAKQSRLDETETQRTLGVSLPQRESARYRSIRESGGGRRNLGALENFEFWVAIDGSLDSLSARSRWYVVPIVEAIRGGQSIETFLAGKDPNEQRRFRYHWGKFVTLLAMRPAIIERWVHAPTQATIFG